MLSTSEPSPQRVSPSAGSPALDDPLDGLATTPRCRDDFAGKPVRRAASGLLARAKRDGDAVRLVPAALELLARFPGDDHLQRIAAALVSRLGDRRLAEAGWRGVVARQPGSSEAFATLFDLLLRRGGVARASVLLARIESDAARGDPAAERLIGLARERLGDRAGAEQAFRASLGVDRSSPLAWLRASALARARGDEAEARRLARLGFAATRDARLRRPAPPPPAPFRPREARAPRVDPWARPLAELIRGGLVRRDPPRAQPAALGRVVLIGGSLGGGGAERQLVRTALALARAETDAGTVVRGPVSVLCRRLDARGGHDFFLPTLRAAGVPVADYLSLPVYGPEPARSLLAGVRRQIETLPARMREGTERLTDHLAALAPDVVQIWQDGMITAAGLAALLAGVPRIVLNVRTLPPSERADRWKPEAEALFRGLVGAPGVVLTANSAIAARAYEAWLDLPRGRVAVVPNGVDTLSPIGTPDAEAAAAAFGARAPGDFTLGGVMRLDANKRPLDWLLVAERLLALHPAARFMLVGDGELASVARDFSRQRGIADRVLFVGRSPAVGFWLSRMDALLLCSRFEGTPNVLIEAQLAGVPVVSTPAGGAEETFVQGVTGVLLPSAEEVDVEAAARALAEMAAWSPVRRAEVARRAQLHALHAFSAAAMTRATLETFAGAAL